MIQIYISAEAEYKRFVEPIHPSDEYPWRMVEAVQTDDSSGMKQGDSIQVEISQGERSIGKRKAGLITAIPSSWRRRPALPSF